MIKPTDCLWARNGNHQCPDAPQEQYQKVGWAISYDGKTPYSFWAPEYSQLVDAGVKRFGGTASKMALYAKVNK